MTSLLHRTALCVKYLTNMPPSKQKLSLYVTSIKVFLLTSELKRKKGGRQLERLWRRSKSAIDREEFVKQKEQVKQMLEDSDTEYYSNLVMENSGNSRRLYNTLNKMLRKKNESQLPPHDLALQLADEFMEYFIAKIERIRTALTKLLLLMVMNVTMWKN